MVCIKFEDSGVTIRLDGPSWQHFCWIFDFERRLVIIAVEISGCVKDKIKLVGWEKGLVKHLG